MKLSIARSVTAWTKYRRMALFRHNRVGCTYTVVLFSVLSMAVLLLQPDYFLSSLNCRQP